MSPIALIQIAKASHPVGIGRNAVVNMKLFRFILRAEMSVR